METLFLGPHGIRVGWRIGFFVALFLLFVLLLQIACAALRIPLIPQGGLTPLFLFTQESVAAAACIAATLVMCRVEGRRFGEFGMPARGMFGLRFWQGVVWGLATMSLLMLLIRFFGGYSFGELALHGATLARYGAEWGALFFLVGVYEESFFRGYLQFTLASSARFWPAALTTSAVFGAVHLRNPGEGTVGALSVFVTGMFLCFTLRRTGDLWFAIGWHAAYDFSETYLYSVPNSGIVLPGHLLAASFHGPAWLTGGTVGPEGSAFDFVVMAVVFAAFGALYKGWPATEEATRE